MARHSSRRTGRHDWAPYRVDERALRTFSPHAEHRLAIAYANTYAVGMSSLGFLRVYELVHDHPAWTAERFFTNGSGMPLSVESERALGDFRAIAFSVSFEQDYVGLVRMLDRAGIPARREARTAWHPLVIMGGSCAAINPLPMAAFVDVFALGAAENLLPELLAAIAEEPHREAIVARLAEVAGFFVPAHHHPESARDFPKLTKRELGAEQMRQPGNLPVSSIITPRTELAGKALVEMSRGCPEKCKYCWATFGMGKFRWHPTEHILAALERLRPLTDQVGFVATAVGDHPEIARILRQSQAAGFRAAVSSIRIPAVTEHTLAPLFASGARSVTLAPETGSDRLRAIMNKPIPNALLLEKVRLIFRHGFTGLKLYFILGLPGETDEDVAAILTLAAACQRIMVEEGRKTGVVGTIHLGTNVLIPKPFTPWQREPMADEQTLRRKLAELVRGAAQIPNVTLTAMSPREATWQTYISRAGRDAADAIERMARGQSLSTVLRDLSARIHPEVFQPFPRQLRWHFMRTG